MVNGRRRAHHHRRRALPTTARYLRQPALRWRPATCTLGANSPATWWRTGGNPGGNSADHVDQSSTLAATLAADKAASPATVSARPRYGISETGAFARAPPPAGVVGLRVRGSPGG